MSCLKTASFIILVISVTLFWFHYKKITLYVHCPLFEVRLTWGKSKVTRHNLLNPLDWANLYLKWCVRRLCVRHRTVSNTIFIFYWYHSLLKGSIISNYTGSFKKIWTSSTLATEVTGPDTLWFFSYGDTLKTMPTNHKLQDRIRDAVQTIEGEQVS